jgi:hypothetical protein
MKHIAKSLLLLLSVSTLFARTVVFWQPGFPTAGSQPITRETLAKALDGAATVFASLDALRDSTTLNGADLLVLPYGSAIPVEGWPAIQAYLRTGGDLLILGGQPLRVPVTSVNGKFVADRPQDTYSRDLGINHSYEAPQHDGTSLAWREGYSFLKTRTLHARRFFVLEGRVTGLGFMVNAEGLQVAAPVVVIESRGGGGRGGGGGAAGRIVALDFDPAAGYWESPDGVSLIRDSAGYARQGGSTLSLEMPFSTIKPDEVPKVLVHLRDARRQPAPASEVKVELLSGSNVLDTVRVPVTGNNVNTEAAFSKAVPPGFYTVRGEWDEGGQPREAYQNGLWVEDQKLLASGPALGVKADFLTRDGKPFFPVGANYFSTEANGWDFAGPRNAWIWERDFDEMQRYGVTFVRTGVWGPTIRLIDPANKGVTERFLRNLEAFLLSAHRHNIIVNFTFYAFTPRPLDPVAAPTAPPPAAAPAAGRGGRGAPQGPAEPNVYMDAASVKSELNYVLSIVNRFKDVPWLCWDLINEPSFSNPNRLWTGNTPNGDPAELALWHQWLAKHYKSPVELGAAWQVTPEQLGSLDNVPLPTITNLTFDRYKNAGMIRASDYNLFAQDMFTEWVRSMVTAIRGAGSQQLIDVGQDEGGVTNRVLNQFYGAGGVAFTTNHTYWQEDALLWDSVAAKRPGMPSIVGETGYQPVRTADGTWRLDELTGTPLNEKRWALGFAAANSGAMMWDWDREVDFGIKRSDGSAKILQSIMRDMGQFAGKAAPYATDLVSPQVALVLPQSYQLSIYNSRALEAQQNAVRGLYQYARAEAYAVGEYQIEGLGNPKLILLPSPFGLAPHAWDAIRAKVEAGATLLVTGPFDGDAHFHPTGRAAEIGLPFETVPLDIREDLVRWPGGETRLSFGGDRTTYLDRALLPNGNSWAEKNLGKGKILFLPLPLELNDNLAAIGDFYKYALKLAGVAATYTTTLQDPGILICPTRFPHATLYVVTSESDQRQVSFRDQRSGKTFSANLDPGRSALILIGEDGTALASYNWKK